MQPNNHIDPALARSRLRLREAFLSSPDGVAMIRQSDFSYTDVNDRFCRITGYARSTLLGTPVCASAFWQKDNATNEMLASLSTGAPLMHRLNRIHPLGSPPKPVLLSATFLPIGGEEHLLLVMQELSDPEQTGRLFEKSEERYRQLFNNMSSGVLVLQPASNGRDFLIIDCNLSAATIEKKDRRQLIGAGLGSIRAARAGRELADACRHVRSRKGPRHVEVSRKKNDVVLMWQEFYIYRLPSGEIVLVYDDITEKKKDEVRLHAYQRELRSLATELSLVEENERRALATDLHDHVGQTLSAIKMKLHFLAGKDNIVDAGELASLLGLVQETLDATRSLTFSLSPPVLFELGLVPAIHWLADHMRERYSLKVAVATSPAAIDIDETKRSILFRGISELLVNVAKHAKTDRASVTVEQKEKMVRIVVEDHGCGFCADTDTSYKHTRNAFGLFHLRERLMHFGGRLELSTKPGRGARVILEI